MLLAAAPALATDGGAGENERADVVAAGIGAKLACSAHFVSGRPLEGIVHEDVESLLPVLKDMTYKVAQAAGTVTVTKGKSSRTAVYRPALGCTLLAPGTTQLAEQPRPAPTPHRNTATNWPTRVDETAMPGLDRAALDRAVAAMFAPPSRNGKDEFRTRAVIVVHDGRIVAERYAPGFTKDTRQLGWSMSKGVTATLAGMLVAEGKLRLDAPVGLPEWSGHDDPRGRITLSQLLRMSSGLRFEESYLPGKDAVTMLFEQPDMAGYAAGLPLVHPPGTVWSYSSGGSNIASALVKRALGGGAAMQDYARRRLFDPLGMDSVVFEQDQAGTPVGSSYVYATPRDWARLGQLFLDEGRAGKRRIVPASWIRYMRLPAPADPQANYGAQVWLNGFRPDHGTRTFPDLPADSYAPQGYNGQSLLVVPSRRTVILRMGWTTGDAPFDMNPWFGPILAALPSR
jgi:CubicO group peptidase (beta-lactamase class C family)